MLNKNFSIALLLLGIAAGVSVGPASANPGSGAFSFGLWGDMPYKKAGDDAKLPAVLQSINQSDIAFSIYDGDIKDGSSKCTDDVYTDALKMFDSLVKPVVYVPGDNEWTDCHRLNNGGYDTLERLSHMRKVMFPTTDSLGQTRMPLQRQGKLGEKYVENMRFQHGGVLFVGINMPGSNNNLVLNPKECTAKSARKAAQCDAANAEYLERDSANVEWMKSAFELAAKDKASGVVLVVQGDPGFDWPETEDADESALPDFLGYRNFMTALTAQTEKFAARCCLCMATRTFSKSTNRSIAQPNCFPTSPACRPLAAHRCTGSASRWM